MDVIGVDVEQGRIGWIGTVRCNNPLNTETDDYDLYYDLPIYDRTYMFIYYAKYKI